MGVVLGDTVLTVAGVLVIVAFWTSRLVIADGTAPRHEDRVGDRAPGEGGSR